MYNINLVLNNITCTVLLLLKDDDEPAGQQEDTEGPYPPDTDTQDDEGLIDLLSSGKKHFFM